MFFKFTGLDGSEVGSEASIWPSPLYLCSVCYKPRQSFRAYSVPGPEDAKVNPCTEGQGSLMLKQALELGSWLAH